MKDKKTKKIYRREEEKSVEKEKKRKGFGCFGRQKINWIEWLDER
jgi:hypothetical protein